jgi:anionic cell wall polymer biosynthesis LytR-Cps2A-Psr (LCP) family protein
MASDERNSNFDDKDDQSENDDLFSHYSSKSDDEFKDPDFDDDRSQPFKKREQNGLENENLEKDFFKDSDFEFKDYEDGEYDVNGVRDVRVKNKKKRRKIILSTILIMSILVVVAIGIVFGYRYIKNKFFSAASTTTSTTEQAIVVPSSLKLTKDLSIVISCAGNNLLEPELNSVIFSKYSSTDTEMISLCVPINALMEIPGFGLDSINKSVEFGGMDLLKLTLKNTLGMDVNNYMLMDIVNIVNKLESINLKLDEDITITAGDGSKTELKKGDNIINGETALNYLKYFSGVNTDVPIASISKQKILLDSLAKKIIGEKEGDMAKNFTKINDYIDTDLNLEELSELVSTIAGLDSDKNKSYALEGSTVELEGKTFYVPDITKIANIFNEGSVVQNGNEEPATTGETLTLSVLNGVGIKGIAAKTSDLLKDLKFSDGKLKYNVTTVGDADNYEYAQTQIVLKSGEQNILAAAEDIKKILKVGNITTQEEGGTQATDIVVIVGKDFNYDAALAASTSTSETGTEETTTSTSSTDTETTESAQIVFDVNVLNGEGTQGIAATVQGILEKNLNKDKKTIKVVEATNADNFSYSQTKIITFTDKEGIQDVAKKIKEVLGVGVISASTDNPDKVDVTVIIGSDYTK